MKKRDIILDFTSLLDITLIVIFFFVLFSHLDSEENKAITEAKVKELEIAIEKADAKEANAAELVEQLEQEIRIVREVDERQAANVEELLSYQKSGNIKMILVMQENGWILRVQSPLFKENSLNILLKLKKQSRNASAFQLCLSSFFFCINPR